MDQREWEEILPVNLSCFEGVDWEGLKVENRDWRLEGLWGRG